MDILKKVENFAKKEYVKNDSKHQWPHIHAVMKRALEIANNVEDVDYEILKISVMLHDIDYHSEKDFKTNYENHVDNSIKVAEKFLRDNNYTEDKIKKVKQVMLDHSTPHRKKFGDSKLIEGKILYDADKSLFLTTTERYEKYFSLLYLDATRKLVNTPEK